MSLSLHAALERLLVDRAYRSAFLERRFDALDLAPGVLEALSTIDRAQLVRTADRVCADILTRQYRGSGGLQKLYPQTFAAWARAHPEDAAAGFVELGLRFLESPAYQRYREFPYAGVGDCLEEAFFRFAEAADLGAPETRERERTVAVVKALALNPRPGFAIPEGVKRVRRGYFAVTRSGPPHLCAAVGGQLVEGPLTPFLAALLISGRPAPEVAAEHGVDPPVLAASLQQLRALGVLDS